jgi:hypothetical protein
MLQIVSLVSLESSPLNWDASDRVLGLFGKLSRRRRRRRGALAWFHGIWTCIAKVL